MRTVPPKIDALRGTLAAAAELARPDWWHREQARHRLRSGGVPYRPPAAGALGAALMRLARAWDVRALADADAAWGALLLPAERLGQVDAARVVARATPEQATALCVGPKRGARVAFRDWFARHGRLAAGQRSYASRGGR